MPYTVRALENVFNNFDDEADLLFYARWLFFYIVVRGNDLGIFMFLFRYKRNIIVSLL